VLLRRFLRPPSLLNSRVPGVKRREPPVHQQQRPVPFQHPRRSRPLSSKSSTTSKSSRPRSSRNQSPLLRRIAPPLFRLPSRQRLFRQPPSIRSTVLNRSTPRRPHLRRVPLAVPWPTYWTRS